MMMMFPPVIGEAALERRSRQRAAFQGAARPVAEPAGKRRIAQHAIGTCLVHAGQLESPWGWITDVGSRRTARLLPARDVQVGTVAPALARCGRRRASGLLFARHVQVGAVTPALARSASRRAAGWLACHVQVGAVTPALAGQIADCLSLSSNRSLRWRATRHG